MGASRASLGVVVSILLAGCAPGASGDASTEQATSTLSTSRATATPTAESPEPPPTPPTGPEGGIPADLELPGQADGKVEPRTDAGRLYDYICLDPQAQWTLGLGFVEAQTVVIPGSTPGTATTIEKLAAYPSAEQAARAVRGLRAQVDLCGDGADHAGNPKTWRASDLTSLPSADEAVRLTYRSEGVVSTVVTVVRVGRAVFYVDRREQHADGVLADERTVAEFVPTLATAFR